MYSMFQGKKSCQKWKKNNKKLVQKLSCEKCLRSAAARAAAYEPVQNIKSPPVYRGDLITTLKIGDIWFFRAPNIHTNDNWTIFTGKGTIWHWCIKYVSLHRQRFPRLGYCKYAVELIEGLVQTCSNSIAYALELLEFYTESSRYRNIFEIYKTSFAKLCLHHECLQVVYSSCCYKHFILLPPPVSFRYTMD